MPKSYAEETHKLILSGCWQVMGSLLGFSLGVEVLVGTIFVFSSALLVLALVGTHFHNTPLAC